MRGGPCASDNLTGLGKGQEGYARDPQGLMTVTDLRKGSGEDKVSCERVLAAQRRAQKNFFSRKGFSEVGTGVMRGSSQAWASQ